MPTYGGAWRAHPVVAALGGVALAALGAAVAWFVWEEQYLLVPTAFLLLGVICATALGRMVGGITAVAAATALFIGVFMPAREGSPTTVRADISAVLAFSLLAIVLAVIFDQVLRSRRRADRTLASLDGLVVNAPIGVAFLDRDLRFVRVNDALTRIAGRDVTEHLGRTLDDVIGRDDATGLARQVLATGEPALDVPLSGVSRDGRRFDVVAGYYPVRGRDGSIEGVGVVVRDVTAALGAERQRDELFHRLSRLQRITGNLAAARTTTDVVQVVLEDVRVSAAADAASLCTVVGDQVHVVGSTGYRGEVVERWARMPLDGATPLAAAVRRGEIVVAGDRATLHRQWPELTSSLPEDRHAVIALPLLVDGMAQGAIGLSYDREMHPSEEDCSFLAALGTQCAQAMLRARLHESEQAAQSRLEFLAEASDALAGTLDWELTLRNICGLAVPRLADFAAAFVVRDETIAALDIAHADPARAANLARIIERWPATLDRSVGIGRVVKTGEPVMANDLGPEQIALVARDQEHAAALLEAGFRSLLAVPMRAGEEIVGVIVLANEAGRSLSDADLALATELATRAGQAVVNARLFRERSNVAATLQASLLPPATPEIPGTQVATRFFALGEGIDVGGDFYDVFRLGTLAEPDDRWAVVIGDVQGKGTEAASISGTARHAVRATGLHERSPAAMLTRLNELLLVTASDDEPRFCTAVVATVEPREGGAAVVLAVGGHPPPFVLRNSGEVETVHVQGSLIGVLPDPELSEVRIDLHRGDALVLYTDGVTERHSGNQFFDEEGLAAVLSRCAGFTAAALAERIETASRAFVEGAPRDDLAIVVVRVPEGSTASTTSADLPDDVTAPTLARRFVLAALDALGPGADAQAEVAALLASELATNALLHGAAPFRISMEPAPGAVRVAVSDAGPSLPTRRPPDPDREGGRGIALVELLASRWGVEPRDQGKSVWFELPL